MNEKSAAGLRLRPRDRPARRRGDGSRLEVEVGSILEAGRGRPIASPITAASARSDPRPAAAAPWSLPDFWESGNRTVESASESEH